MGELVKFLAQSLVEQPELVDVKETNNEDSVIIELRVAPDDMGRIIGKQGKIAKSIRTVMNAVAIKKGKNVSIEIIQN